MNEPGFWYVGGILAGLGGKGKGVGLGRGGHGEDTEGAEDEGESDCESESDWDRDCDGDWDWEWGLGEFEDYFCDFLAAGGGEGVGGAVDFEAAFLQDAHGGVVVVGGAGEKRPFFLLGQELGQGGGGDASSPILTADPIGYFAVAGALKAGYMAGDLIVQGYGSDDDFFVGGDLGPVVVEGGTIGWVFGREGGHEVGLGIELLVEEDGEIALADGA